jgi:hypothetical protein
MELLPVTDPQKRHFRVHDIVYHREEVLPALLITMRPSISGARRAIMLCFVSYSEILRATYGA